MSREQRWARAARAMADERKLELDGKAFTGSDEKVAADALRLIAAKRDSITALEALATVLSAARRPQ